MNFVFFASSISGIGGAQQYVLRKAKHLRSKDHNVLIVTSKTDPLLLDEFSEFPFLRIPEIIYPCFYFSEGKKKKVVKKVLDFLNQNVPSKNFICESVTIQIGTWAEEICKRIKAVSFVYEIDGSPLKYLSLANFAAYKQKNGQLVGCSEFIFMRTFSSFRHLYTPSLNRFINIPFDRSEVVENGEEDLGLADNRGKIRLLTVSRTEKYYLAELIKETSFVAKQIPRKLFSLTIVVDRQSGSKFRFLQKISTCIPANLSVHFVGPFVPLPSWIFENHDIFVGGGTSSLHAIAWGLSTIIMDSKSNMSAGIMGIDVNTMGYCPKYDRPVSYYLMQLIENPTLLTEAKKKGRSLFLKSFDAKIVMKEFDQFVSAKCFQEQKEYFDFSSTKLTGEEYLKKMVLSFWGAGLTSKLNINKIRHLWK